MATALGFRDPIGESHRAVSSRAADADPIQTGPCASRGLPKNQGVRTGELLMAEASAKRKLLQLLDRRVWRPILRAPPRSYSEPERKILAQVQKKTERERERFQAYPDATCVR